MKKFLSLTLCAMVLFASCCFVFARSVSAAEYEYVLIPEQTYTFTDEMMGSYDCTFVLSDIETDVSTLYEQGIFQTLTSVTVICNGVSYECAATFEDGGLFAFGGPIIDDTETISVTIEPEFDNAYISLAFGFVAPEGSESISATVGVFAGKDPSGDTPSDPGTGDTPTNPDTGDYEPIYYSIYELICNAFYGENELTGWQELVATSLATCACVLVFALPFVVIYWFVRLFFRY